jgi:hypothetical protein
MCGSRCSKRTGRSASTWGDRAYSVIAQMFETRLVSTSALKRCLLKAPACGMVAPGFSAKVSTLVRFDSSTPKRSACIKLLCVLRELEMARGQRLALVLLRGFDCSAFD